LVLLMLSGCGAEKQLGTTPFERTTPTFVSTGPTEPDESPEEPQKPKMAEIQVLDCRFREQILPADYEVYVGRFPPEEGEVYVDLSLRVRNTCDVPIDGKDISAYFEYAGKRYTMQFEVVQNAGDFMNQSKKVRPGECKTVHLFYRVKQAAQSETLTVHLNALGQEQTLTVAEYTEPEKTILKVGQTFVQEGQYSLEILRCGVASQIYATGAGSVRYQVEGSDVLFLTMKVRNLGYSDLDYLEGYLLMGEQPEFAAVQWEINDNLELEDWSGVISSGQVEIIHLWVAVPQDTPAAGMALRLNVQEDSFCCYALG
jgi:hypothetical protein